MFWPRTNVLSLTFTYLCTYIQLFKSGRPIHTLAGFDLTTLNTDGDNISMSLHR
jgi:hypothetical protein